MNPAMKTKMLNPAELRVAGYKALAAALDVRPIRRAKRANLTPHNVNHGNRESERVHIY